MSESREREGQELRARERQELHAYRDGELPFHRRWRVRRRLARDAAVRRELASIDELGALLREQAAAQPVPDLWDGVRAQLATAPRPAPLEADDAMPAPVPWLPAWLGAALAAASVAAVMASEVLSGDAAPVGSVRWIDANRKPVMVLQDDRDATIIWVLEKPAETSGGARDAVAV
jgi:anti-sigma factor RsiW